MLHKKKIVVVLPAYQAEKTLERSYQDIPKDIVDQIIMVDDASSDRTVEVANRLGIKTIVHKNILATVETKSCFKNGSIFGGKVILNRQKFDIIRQ